MSFFCCLASFLFAVWFCIYTHAQLRILKFQDSMYQKAEVYAHTINELRKSKRSVCLLRRQIEICVSSWSSFFLLFVLVFMIRDPYNQDSGFQSMKYKWYFERWTTSLLFSMYESVLKLYTNKKVILIGFLFSMYEKPSILWTLIKTKLL